MKNATQRLRQVQRKVIRSSRLNYSQPMMSNEARLKQMAEISQISESKDTPSEKPRLMKKKAQAYH